LIIIKRKKHIASSIKRATIKYKERVLPVLNDWGSEVEDYGYGTDSRASAHLTESMKIDVTLDSGSEDATYPYTDLFQRSKGENHWL
jgi:hypothetical protein